MSSYKKVHPTYIDGHPFIVRSLTGGRAVNETGEWDDIVSRFAGADQPFYADGVLTWCQDTLNGYNDYRILRGGPAATGSYRAEADHCYIDAGFRPVLIPLDPETLQPSPDLLKSNYSDPSTLTFGTLYMNGKPLPFPTNHTLSGDIPDYISAASLKVGSSGPNSANRIRWINAGSFLVCDRCILKSVSWTALDENGLIFGAASNKKTVPVTPPKHFIKAKATFSKLKKKTFKKISQKESATQLEFNKSDNPLAYLRTDTDIDQYIANMKQVCDSQYVQDLTSKEVRQLLWLTTAFLVKDTSPNDRTVDSMLKLLSCATTGKTNVFQTLIGDIEDLKDKYTAFKCKTLGTDNVYFEQVVQESVAFISSCPQSSLLVGLKNEAFPLQADLVDDGTTYSLWFTPSTSNTLSIEAPDVGFINENTIEVCLPAFLFDSDSNKFIGSYITHEGFQIRDFLNSLVPAILKEIAEARSEDMNESSLSALKAKAPNQQKSGTLTADSTPPADSAPKSPFDKLEPAKGLRRQLHLREELHTAIHESGHVVAAYLLGHDILGASIVSNGECLGRSVWLPLPVHSIETLHDPIITYAGNIAADIYNKGSLPIFCSSNDLIIATKNTKTDVIEESADKIGRKFFYIDPEKLGLAEDSDPYVVYETIRRCEAAYQEAHKLMSENMHLVESFAQDLLARKEISGKEIKDILDRYVAENQRNLQPGGVKS